MTSPSGTRVESSSTAAVGDDAEFTLPFSLPATPQVQQARRRQQLSASSSSSSGSRRTPSVCGTPKYHQELEVGFVSSWGSFGTPPTSGVSALAMQLCSHKGQQGQQHCLRQSPPKAVAGGPMAPSLHPKLSPSYSMFQGSPKGHFTHQRVPANSFGTQDLLPHRGGNTLGYAGVTAMRSEKTDIIQVLERVSELTMEDLANNLDGSRESREPQEDLSSMQIDSGSAVGCKPHDYASYKARQQILSIDTQPMHSPAMLSPQWQSPRLQSIEPSHFQPPPPPRPATYILASEQQRHAQFAPQMPMSPDLCSQQQTPPLQQQRWPLPPQFTPHSYRQQFVHGSYAAMPQYGEANGGANGWSIATPNVDAFPELEDMAMSSGPSAMERNTQFAPRTTGPNNTPTIAPPPPIPWMEEDDEDENMTHPSASVSSALQEDSALRAAACLPMRQRRSTTIWTMAEHFI